MHQKKTSRLASSESTTCVIFDAWHHPWVAVYKTWKERQKNWPLPTWLRWRIWRVLNTGVHLRDLHTLDNSLASTCLFILWEKIEKWSWCTVRLAFYQNNRARQPSDSTCAMVTSVTSSIQPNKVDALLVSDMMPHFLKPIVSGNTDTPAKPKSREFTPAECIISPKPSLKRLKKKVSSFHQS